ncbi:MAG: hypothetical protein WBI07_18225 [Mobilitalea sp.]
MIEALAQYRNVVDTVLEENPILSLERQLGKNSIISPGEVIQLGIKLRKLWSSYSKYGIEMGLILTEKDCGGNTVIYEYDFNKDIENIILGGKKKSNFYYLNSKSEICEIMVSDEIISVEQCSKVSKELEKVVIHLGIRGVDIFINGVVYSSDNFLKSYKDLMDTEKMLDIFEYDKLLEGFYKSNIEYDIYKRYFLRKDDISKEIYDQTIGKYPKLLRNKPEEFFQMDFVKYLKEHCRDAVIKEYTTETGDRYDVLVHNENQGVVYVFEIKWLGRAITTGMKIFEKYNSEERAISGAYQLIDYVDNADTYKEYFLELPIYCAILLVFDARDVNTAISYPPEVMGRPNVDLNRCLFMNKDKVSASTVYAKMKRK